MTSTARYISVGAIGATIPLALHLGPTGPGMILAAILALAALAVGYSFGIDRDSDRLRYNAGRRHGFTDGWDRAMSLVDAREQVDAHRRHLQPVPDDRQAAAARAMLDGLNHRDGR